MADRSRAPGAERRPPETSAGSPAVREAPRPLTPEDERLNDDINGLLRDAAEQRERRTAAQTAEDTASARRQFEAVVALSRARGRKARGAS